MLKANDGIPGFSWHVVGAFREALARCAFDRGDTFYSHSDAYEAWTTENATQRSAISSIQVIKSHGVSDPDDKEGFSANWNAGIEIDFRVSADGPGIRTIMTTNGRLFSFLWHGDPTILDETSPHPPFPSRLPELLKALIAHRSDCLRFLKEKPHQIAPPLDHFLLPYDELSELSHLKNSNIQAAIRHAQVPAQEFDIVVGHLGIKDDAVYSPTLKVRCFSVQPSPKRSLKSIICHALSANDSPRMNFQISRHGLLVSTSSSLVDHG
jgi:hypothetical protein